MCGYDPFEWYDYQLDREKADELHFETVADLYYFMATGQRPKKEQIKKLFPVDFMEISENDLHLWYDLALRYEDTTYLKAIKTALKQRGLAWK